MAAKTFLYFFVFNTFRTPQACGSLPGAAVDCLSNAIRFIKFEH